MDNEKFRNGIKESQKLLFEDYRLQTFNNNWNELKGFKYCTPRNFAAAGFYNLSSSTYPDNVKCFACQKELSDWEENDDPWKEHQKRGNNCPFIIFKNLKAPTVHDSLQLFYEAEKNAVKYFFEKQKNNLKEAEKNLLKLIDSSKKTKI